MGFFATTFLNKKDLTFINSVSNPTLPSVGEADIIMDDDGVTCHMWDREVGGTTLRYRTANNALLDNWSGFTACTGLPLGIFPLVFKYNGILYLLWKHNSDLKYYIYTTTNRIAWTMVAGPIISASTVATDWNKNIYNVGGSVVGNKLHLMLEGNADSGFYYFPSHLGYCRLNLDTFTMEVNPPVAVPTVYNSLCPVLVYSKENNSIVSIFSEFDLVTSTPPSAYMGGTRAMTASLDKDPSLTSTWEISTIKFPEFPENRNVANSWAADFAICFTPNKTYPMVMYYNWNQSTGYQAYSILKNEQELFTAVKFAGNPK